MLNLAVASILLASQAAQPPAPPPSDAPGLTPAPSPPAPPEFKMPELLVGADAPALWIGKWFKGDAAPTLEKGTVYVLYFWATWSQSSVQHLPHLSDLQKTLTGTPAGGSAGGVRVIAIASEDRRGMTLERAEKIFADRADTVSITGAWDASTRTAASYLTAGGGATPLPLPTAFVVDRSGKIAFIGHPSLIDDTLQSVAAGTFDLAKASERYKVAVRNRFDGGLIINEFNALVRAQNWGDAAKACERLVTLDSEIFGVYYAELSAIHWQRFQDLEAAYKIAQRCHADRAQRSGEALLRITRMILNLPEGTRKDLDLALQCITRADEIEKGRLSIVLETKAMTHGAKGDYANALESQKAAIDRSRDANQRKRLEDGLAKYRAALTPRAPEAPKTDPK